MKINLKAFSIVILHGRIFRPYYLAPETGDLFSSRCLDAKTLKFCNASDLNPKTGTVRTALCLRPHSGKNMIAVFGESTIKIYEDVGYIKMDIPFCSAAYLCQTFLRSRFPDKQEREAVCREYGIDDSYDLNSSIQMMNMMKPWKKEMMRMLLLHENVSASFLWRMRILTQICFISTLRSIFAWHTAFAGVSKTAICLRMKHFMPLDKALY